MATPPASAGRGRRLGRTGRRGHTRRPVLFRRQFLYCSAGWGGSTPVRGFDRSGVAWVPAAHRRPTKLTARRPGRGRAARRRSRRRIARWGLLARTPWTNPAEQARGRDPLRQSELSPAGAPHVGNSAYSAGAQQQGPPSPPPVRRRNPAAEIAQYAEFARDRHPGYLCVFCVFCGAGSTLTALPGRRHRSRSGSSAVPAATGYNLVTLRVEAQAAG
jgi:hypothetical protein